MEEIDYGGVNERPLREDSYRQSTGPDTDTSNSDDSRKNVASLVVHDYYFPKVIYPRNMLTRKGLKTGNYSTLNRRKRKSPVFFADVKLKEGSSSWRKAGHLFSPVSSNPLQDELYHIGLEWKPHPGADSTITSEACMDVANVVRRNDLEDPKLTAYLVDLGGSGNGDYKYQIQEREKGIQEHPIKGIITNPAVGFMRLLPWTNNEKWKMKSLEFGKLFNVYGDFGFEKVSTLTLDEAPIRAWATHRIVDYNLRDNDNTTYAKIHTEALPRALTGGFLGHGGFIRNTRVDIFDERLMNDRFFQLSAFLANIVNKDIKERNPKKLERTASFEKAEADRLMQFAS